jgi:hypothetical protein
MLIKLKLLNFKKILSKIRIYEIPDLKISNSFFSISSFFYSYSLIKKILDKNNLFYLKEKETTKIAKANLQRFEKPLRRKWLLKEKDIVKMKITSLDPILRSFINEQNFKKL